MSQRKIRSKLQKKQPVLALDAEVQAEALALENDDQRLSRLTEARLRHLMGQEVIEQRQRFKALLQEPYLQHGMFILTGIVRRT